MTHTILNLDAQQEFENAVGRAGAEKLLRLYKRTYPAGTEYDRLFGAGRSREEQFRVQARLEGFTPTQVEMFLDLQK